MQQPDADDAGHHGPPGSLEPAAGAFGGLLGGDELGGDGPGGDLLRGNDFADLIPELESTRPDHPPDPADPAAGQPVDDPQYDDTDPYPYGIADL